MLHKITIPRKMPRTLVPFGRNNEYVLDAEHGDLGSLCREVTELNVGCIDWRVEIYAFPSGNLYRIHGDKVLRIILQSTVSTLIFSNSMFSEEDINTIARLCRKQRSIEQLIFMQSSFSRPAKLILHKLVTYLDLHRFDIEDVELDESLLLGLVGSFGPCLRFLRLSNVSLGQSTFDQIPGALEKRGCRNIKILSLTNNNNIKNLAKLGELLRVCSRLERLCLPGNLTDFEGNEAMLLSSDTGTHATLRMIYPFEDYVDFNANEREITKFSNRLKRWMLLHRRLNVRLLMAFVSRSIQNANSRCVVSRLFPEVDRLVGEMLIHKQ